MSVLCQVLQAKMQQKMLAQQALAAAWAAAAAAATVAAAAAPRMPLQQLPTKDVHMLMLC